jgi:hypothetical protein
VNGLAATAVDRLRASDVTQVATLVMAGLVIALSTVWPSAGAGPNESWYGFAQARAVILALLALGFGASAALEPARRAVATAFAVLVISLLAVPLEVAAYAATYPATPLWWPLLGIVLAPGAYFVLGVGLGLVATKARLSAFLPLLVPAVVVGLLLLDVRLGWTVFNPLTAALQVSLPYAAATGVLSLLCLLWATQRWRHAQGRPEVSP